MSMAKRQQDLKDPSVRKRIEEFLKEDGMAEQLKVRFEGEGVVFEIIGLKIRLSLTEAESLSDYLKAAIMMAIRVREARMAEEESNG
jgi:hypothetical protein